MRKFLILSLVFAFCSPKKKESFEYFDSGELKAKGFIQNGLRIGNWMYYSKSGDLVEVFKYQEGKPIKRLTYISNQLAIDEDLKDSLRHGKVITYHGNGNIKGISHHRAGKQVGELEDYYYNGNLKVKYVLDSAGIPTDFHQYHSNGKLFMYAKYFDHGITNVYDSLGNPTHDLMYYKGQDLPDTVKVY